MTERLGTMFALLFSVIVFSSCAADFEARATPYTKGHILVMPARDAIPVNASEKNLNAAVNSGAKLSDLLVTEFQNRGWDVSALDASEGANHAAPIAAQQALESGRKVGANFVLTTVMGDLRDAAPFTIVDDYVELDDARLYDCATGTVVWELAEPFHAIDNAFGDASGAVWSLAVLISQSIESNAQ